MEITPCSFKNIPVGCLGWFFTGLTGRGLTEENDKTQSALIPKRKWVLTRAEELIEIKSKLQYGQEQYPNSRSCIFFNHRKMFHDLLYHYKSSTLMLQKCHSLKFMFSRHKGTCLFGTDLRERKKKRKKKKLSHHRHFYVFFFSKSGMIPLPLKLWFISQLQYQLQCDFFAYCSALVLFLHKFLSDQILSYVKQLQWVTRRKYIYCQAEWGCQPSWTAVPSVPL